MLIFFLLVLPIIFLIKIVSNEEWRPRDIISKYPELNGKSTSGIIDPNSLLNDEEINEIKEYLEKLKEKDTYPFIIVLENLNNVYSKDEEGFQDFIDELSFLITPLDSTHKNVILIGIEYDKLIIKVNLGSEIGEKINDNDLKFIKQEGENYLKRKALSEAIRLIIDKVLYYIDHSSFERILLVVRIILYLIVAFLVGVTLIFLFLQIYSSYCYLNKEEVEILKQIKLLCIQYETDENSWKTHCLICLKKFDFQKDTNLLMPNIKDNLQTVPVSSSNRSILRPLQSENQTEVALEKSIIKEKCNHIYHRECLMKIKKFCGNDCPICDILFKNGIGNNQFRDNLIFIQKMVNPKFKNLYYKGNGKDFQWRINVLSTTNEKKPIEYEIENTIFMEYTGKSTRGSSSEEEIEIEKKKEKEEM